MEIYLGSLSNRSATELAERALAQRASRGWGEATLAIDSRKALYLGTWSDQRAGSGRALMLVDAETDLTCIVELLDSLKPEKRSAA